MYKLARAFILFLMISIFPVFAIEITPMVVTLSPEKTAPFSIIYNDLPRDIAFDIQVYEVKFDKAGISKPVLIPLNNSPLWVFPPSLFLESGQHQKIQFRWVGDKFPAMDKTYQVSLIEEDINSISIAESSKLRILMNLNLIIHVDQKALKPDLVIGKPYIEKGYLVARVINRGAGAARLSDYNIKIKKKGIKVREYYKNQLKEIGYDVFFPPYCSVLIKFPMPKSIKKDDLYDFNIDLVG